MKAKIIFTAAFAAAAIFCAACAGTHECAQKHRKIALHGYIYRGGMTLEETVGEARRLGADGVACSSTQDISKKYPDVKFGLTMTAEQRAYVKKFFADNKIDMVSFAVGAAPMTPEALDECCKFCADMGIPVFVWEGNPALADKLNESAAKYRITAAVHNHTWAMKTKDFEYRYWSPNFVWSVIKDRPHLAACADDGHWIKMNFDTCMNYRILRGRLAAIHFKNRSQWGMGGGSFTPLADGVMDAAAALRTLDELGYDGYFVLENESCKGAEIAETMKSDIKFLRQH